MSGFVADEGFASLWVSAAAISGVWDNMSGRWEPLELWRILLSHASPVIITSFVAALSMTSFASSLLSPISLTGFTMSGVVDTSFPEAVVTLLLVEVTLSLLVSTSPDIEDTVSVLARLLPLSPSSVE